MGINGFHMNDMVSTLTVRAQETSQLAWIDLEKDRLENFEARLILILVRALLKRQELSLQERSVGAVKNSAAKSSSKWASWGRWHRRWHTS